MNDNEDFNSMNHTIKLRAMPLEITKISRNADLSFIENYCPFKYIVKINKKYYGKSK